MSTYKFTARNNFGDKEEFEPYDLLNEALDAQRRLSEKGYTDFSYPVDEDEDEGVELIASGYEWICPKCEHFQYEIEVNTTVTCAECNKTFEVRDYHHAIG
jgi:hypothetical protein